MGDIAIRVEGLGKRFDLNASGGVRYKALRDNIAGLFSFRSKPRKNSQPSGEFWGLKDLSFEIKRGEVVGLVGRNGAGKSTLLKVLSRITEPTEGYAEIYGRVGSLLEVGTGFHPELTGRENIFLNGAILGMRNKEIVRKFDEIVAFAEVERFIDSPVKFYSSGMFVRLAFAVAAHLEPEILFVDEVLAVGDAAFQKKCLGKMDDVARSGRTVVLVSHNMGAISELCTHGILLDQGRLTLHGEVEKVVEGYGQQLASAQHEVNLIERADLPVSIVSARLSNQDGFYTTTFDIGDEIVMSFDYRINERVIGLQLALTLSRNYVDLIHTFDTDELDQIPNRDPGLYRCELRLPRHFLKAGVYSVRLNAGLPHLLIQDFDGILQFDIEELSENAHNRGFSRGRVGHLISPGHWRTQQLE